MKSFSRTMFLSLLIFKVFVLIFTTDHVGAHRRTTKIRRPFNTTVSAVYVFGDSTVDPGNNNYIRGTIFKSNFPPYGQDFFNHSPTGRFTNGRLVTDFIERMKSFSRTIFLSLLILKVFVLIFTTDHVAAHRRTTKTRRPFNSNVSAVYVFGDSTVDPGNNNYIRGTIFKSNFPPYGQDFFNHIPTGRFTNGRLVTDFLASYIKIKEAIPPYLDPELTLPELLTGVSFASAGAGLDPLTAEKSGVIPIQQQLDYFREYKARIEGAVGKEKAKIVISKAIFLISSGTNDFVVNYFGASSPRRYTYTVSAYQQFLLQNLQDILQGLVEEGAKRIAVVGLPPMGCLPLVITLNSGVYGIQHRRCIDNMSQVAKDYNQQLHIFLKAMSIRYSTASIFYADIFDPLNDMVQNPTKYGFEDVRTGCCGTGLFEGGILCNPTSNLCPDASKKMFWDSIHPTQATYFYTFKALLPVINSVIKD